MFRAPRSGAVSFLSPVTNRVLAAVCTAAVTLLAIGPVAALAATSTVSNATTISGDSTLTAIGFTASGAGVTATGTAEITVHWTQAASIDTTFDPNLVRQGRALDPTDAYARSSTGSMSVDYTLANLQVSWDGLGPFDLGSPTYTTTGDCNLVAGGSDYSCHLESDQITLLDPTPLAGPFVKLRVVSDVTVTPEGIVTLRSASFGGVADGTASLSLGESPITDNLTIPCTVGAGDDMSYALGSFSATDGVSVDTGLEFDVGTSIPNPLFPVPDPVDPVIYITFASPTIDLGSTSGDITVSGDGVSVDMGAVAANNVPPTVDPGGPYSGNEGSPVTFDGSGSSSICGFPTLRWDFSDGGVAFGAMPQHTFQAPGVFSGLLTATDPTGLSSTTTFSVTIANLAPVVEAGPDTTAAWGRLVTFNGSATDPGDDDQSTLSYSWTFGDGSPSASGGGSVFHAYSTPGDYVATLTACDRWGACASDTRTVHVRKRTVSVGDLGDTAGTYDTPGTLSASVVDEFGQAVTGRGVSFTVDGAPAGSGVTNGAGMASVSYTPLVAAGSHATAASFAGDSLYEAGSGSGSITIAVKATSVTYTGALSSKPNKVITLSAVLKDASGKALAGRTIEFVLGSQTASAVTDASGVATTSLKLNQKNAWYPLTATWTPSGADATHYAGSADSQTFSLQAK